MPTGMRVPQVSECASSRGGVARAFALVCRGCVAPAPGAAGRVHGRVVACPSGGPNRNPCSVVFLSG